MSTKKKSDKYEINEEFKFYPDDIHEYIQIPDFPRDDMKKKWDQSLESLYQQEQMKM